MALEARTNEIARSGVRRRVLEERVPSPPSAMGHSWDKDDMTCVYKNCGVSFDEHREKPGYCPRIKGVT